MAKTYKSTAIQNMEAQIPVDNPITSMGGRVRIATLNVTVPDRSPGFTMGTGDTFFIAKLPGHAIVSSILGTWSDVTDNTCTVDIGLYHPEPDKVVISSATGAGHTSGEFEDSDWHSTDQLENGVPYSAGNNSGIAGNVETLCGDINMNTPSQSSMHECWYFDNDPGSHYNNGFVERQLWDVTRQYTEDPGLEFYVGAQIKSFTGDGLTGDMHFCFRLFYTVD